MDQRRREVGVGLARQPLHRGDQDAARLRLELLLGLLERVAPKRAKLVLALEQHLLAQLLADLLGVELRNALEPLANVLGEVADRVARLLDRAALAVQALLALLQLEIEKRQGLLVGPDLAQPDVRLDLAPVEFAVELGPLLLDLRCLPSASPPPAATAASRRATSISSVACSWATRREYRVTSQTTINPTSPPKKRESGNAASVSPPGRVGAISATVAKAKYRVWLT